MSLEQSASIGANLSYKTTDLSSFDLEENEFPSMVKIYAVSERVSEEIDPRNPTSNDESADEVNIGHPPKRGRPKKCGKNVRVTLRDDVFKLWNARKEELGLGGLTHGDFARVLLTHRCEKGAFEANPREKERNEQVNQENDGGDRTHELEVLTVVPDGTEKNDLHQEQDSEKEEKDNEYVDVEHIDEHFSPLSAFSDAHLDSDGDDKVSQQGECIVEYQQESTESDMQNDWVAKYCKSGEITYYQSTTTGNIRFPGQQGTTFSIGDLVDDMRNKGHASLGNEGCSGTLNYYQCSVCEASFSDSGELQKHVKQHIQLITGTSNVTEMHLSSGKTVYGCTKCDTISPSKPTMKKHCGDWHSGKILCKCSACKKEFTKVSLIRAHVRTDHLHEQLFKCKECSEVFLAKPLLLKHVFIAHRTKSVPLKCKKCGQACPTASLLKRHITKLHSPQAPYPCTICQECFCSARALSKHQNVQCYHTCYLCNRAFILEEDYKLHVEKHNTEQRKYECARCSKVFMSKSNLNRHAKIHAKRRV